MIILRDFVILIIIVKLLKVILTTSLKKLYIYYFNFKIYILNNLQKMRNKIKV